MLTEKQIQDYKKAGQISSEVKKYAKSIIKKDVLLVDIAEEIEDKIKELGAEVAFPVNLSIDDVAAHYTPNLDDKTIAQGLLKIDIGVHVNGFIADTAFTLDLTENNEHKKIIQATEDSLKKAQELITKNKEKTELGEIGKVIQQTISDQGFSPIRNLSGHSLDQYNIHAGLTIPNYDNGNKNQIGKGAFAIEPFATTGSGVIYEGPPSNIYGLIKEGNVRDPTARKILAFIQKEKQTLPFSQRELEKHFGIKTRLSLRQLEQAGIIKSYAQFIEKTHKPVTQAENTIIIHNRVEITSE